jgi:hypothetical protein
MTDLQIGYFMDKYKSGYVLIAFRPLCTPYFAINAFLEIYETLRDLTASTPGSLQKRCASICPPRALMMNSNTLLRVYMSENPTRYDHFPFKEKYAL